MLTCCATATRAASSTPWIRRPVTLPSSTGRGLRRYRGRRGLARRRAASRSPSASRTRSSTPPGACARGGVFHATLAQADAMARRTLAAAKWLTRHYLLTKRGKSRGLRGLRGLRGACSLRRHHQLAAEFVRIGRDDAVGVAVDDEGAHLLQRAKPQQARRLDLRGVEQYERFARAAEVLPLSSAISALLVMRPRPGT